MFAGVGLRLRDSACSHSERISDALRGGVAINSPAAKHLLRASLLEIPGAAMPTLLWRFIWRFIRATVAPAAVQRQPVVRCAARGAPRHCHSEPRRCLPGRGISQRDFSSAPRRTRPHRQPCAVSFRCGGTGTLAGPLPDRQWRRTSFLLVCAQDVGAVKPDSCLCSLRGVS